MTEERKELMARFQRWLDTDPLKSIIAAECTNIAEAYAKEKVKTLTIPIVMSSAFGIFTHDTGHVVGYYKTQADAESYLDEYPDDNMYVDELCFTEM